MKKTISLLLIFVLALCCSACTASETKDVSAILPQVRAVRADTLSDNSATYVNDYFYERSEYYIDENQIPSRSIQTGSNTWELKYHGTQEIFTQGNCKVSAYEVIGQEDKYIYVPNYHVPAVYFYEDGSIASIAGFHFMQINKEPEDSVETVWEKLKPELQKFIDIDFDSYTQMHINEHSDVAHIYYLYNEYEGLVTESFSVSVFADGSVAGLFVNKPIVALEEYNFIIDKELEEAVLSAKVEELAGGNEFSLTKSDGSWYATYEGELCVVHNVHVTYTTDDDYHWTEGDIFIPVRLISTLK